MFLAEFRENYKTFNFEPKLSFLRENHKNNNKGEFLDFYEFTLYMFLKVFLKVFSRNSHFQKNSGNQEWNEFVKIQEFTLVIIFVILPQK